MSILWLEEHFDGPGGKYRGWNGNILEISCWADLAQPLAGIKNRHIMKRISGLSLVLTHPTSLAMSIK